MHLVLYILACSATAAAAASTNQFGVAQQQTLVSYNEVHKIVAVVYREPREQYHQPGDHLVKVCPTCQQPPQPWNKEDRLALRVHMLQLLCSRIWQVFYRRPGLADIHLLKGLAPLLMLAQIQQVIYTTQPEYQQHHKNMYMQRHMQYVARPEQRLWKILAGTACGLRGCNNC